MRIVKGRMNEMLPDVKVFLDVDGLSEGKGANFVDRSAVILIFISDGFFESKNCMRELLRAVHTGKSIITLLESDGSRGAVSRLQVSDQLRAFIEGPTEHRGAGSTSR